MQYPSDEARNGTSRTSFPPLPNVSFFASNERSSRLRKSSDSDSGSETRVALPPPPRSAEPPRDLHEPPSVRSIPEVVRGRRHGDADEESGPELAHHHLLCS